MANPAAIPRRSSALSLPLLLCISLLTTTTTTTRAQPFLMPSFLFGWSGGKAAFRAGDTAAITIMALDLPKAASLRPLLSFWLSVKGRRGNSTYVTDVAAHLGDDPSARSITFVPLRAGEFVLLVDEERFSVGASSLRFTVAAAAVHPSASRASWTFGDGGGGARVDAGSRAFVSVFIRDAFGNGIARGDDMPEYFKVSGSYANGSAVELLDFHYNGWVQDGRMGLEFKSNVAGDFMVHVYGDNRELRDSPLMLTVNPGVLNIAKSTCSWKHGINTLQIFSKLEMFIYQKDSFGNIVPEIHPFDAQVVETISKLSIPIVDLTMEAKVTPTPQALTGGDSPRTPQNQW